MNIQQYRLQFGLFLVSDHDNILRLNRFQPVPLSKNYQKLPTEVESFLTREA